MCPSLVGQSFECTDTVCGATLRDILLTHIGKHLSMFLHKNANHGAVNLNNSAPLSLITLVGTST